MPHKKLGEALAAVDWKANIDTFLLDIDATKRVGQVNLRLAIWAKRLEDTDNGNAALPFIREMQLAGQNVAALIALSLYKPAASAIRAVFETALYYLYFRTHSVELATLVRNDGFYIEKKEILDFHKTHTPGFSERQRKLGVISRLDKWYGEISSIVHGQLPGTWVDHTAVCNIRALKTTQDLVINAFVEGEEIVHRFLLCSVGQDLWDRFSSSAKNNLLKGLSGEDKKILKLDAA